MRYCPCVVLLLHASTNLHLCPNWEKRRSRHTTLPLSIGFTFERSFVRRCGLTYTSMPGSVVAKCSRRCQTTVPCTLGVAAHLVAGTYQWCWHSSSSHEQLANRALRRPVDPTVSACSLMAVGWACALAVLAALPIRHRQAHHIHLRRLRRLLPRHRPPFRHIAHHCHRLCHRPCSPAHRYHHRPVRYHLEHRLHHHLVHHRPPPRRHRRHPLQEGGPTTVY